MDLIKVTIPFHGSPQSFQYSSSTCIEIGRNVVVVDDALIATCDGDQQLDGNVNILIDRVSKNLDQLRKEMATYRGELTSSLGSAADERAAAIRARKERDKTRSFPID